MNWLKLKKSTVLEISVDILAIFQDCTLRSLLNFFKWWKTYCTVCKC